jgi:hypothetical protein
MANVSATSLCAEIAKLSAEDLREAAQTREWPLHPLRLQLDTSTRLAAARRSIADLDRNHAAGLWPVTRSQVAARWSDALAEAWARLGGDHGELLFHLRGDLRPDDDRPIMRACVPLGHALTRAFDALGQPTHQQHFRARRQAAPIARRTVWRIRSPERIRRSYLRMAYMAAWHVLDDSGGRNEPERIGVPVLGQYYGHWSPLETAIIGALAWRLACDRGMRLLPRRGTVGHAMTANPANLERLYCELEDPFTPMLAVLKLGCWVHEFSPKVVNFVIEPHGIVVARDHRTKR